MPEQTTEQPVKRKRGRPRKDSYPPPPPKEPEIEKGGKGGKNGDKAAQTKEEKVTMLKFSREVNSLPKIDISNAKKLKKRINEYFDLCEQWQQDATLEGLANALHISRQNLTKTLRRHQGYVLPDEAQEILEDAERVLVQYLVSTVTNGKGSPASSVLMLTNNAGYSDTKLVQHEVDTPFRLGQGRDVKAIQEKYRASIVVDSTMDDLPEAEREENQDD